MAGTGKPGSLLSKSLTATQAQSLLTGAAIDDGNGGGGDDGDDGDDGGEGEGERMKDKRSNVLVDKEKGLWRMNRKIVGRGEGLSFIN